MNINEVLITLGVLTMVCLYTVMVMLFSTRSFQNSVFSIKAPFAMSNKAHYYTCYATFLLMVLFVQMFRRVLSSKYWQMRRNAFIKDKGDREKRGILGTSVALFVLWTLNVLFITTKDIYIILCLFAGQIIGDYITLEYQGKDEEAANDGEWGGALPQLKVTGRTVCRGLRRCYGGRAAARARPPPPLPRFCALFCWCTRFAWFPLSFPS